MRKLVDKANWFKKGALRKPDNTGAGRNHVQGGKVSKVYTQEKPPATVLFCPRTNGSILINRLREMEKEISSLIAQRIKIVKDSGTPLKNILKSLGK